MQPRSDKDALGNALFLMTQSLREAGDVCDAIAAGDYSVEINLKSDRDALGKALSTMTKNLRDSTNISLRED
ncbi:MAG: methyl-accepting chemotaxis sensory transducer [Osedax symbiont Rs2]|nr:MAG: methyl-accepting chemotaxis sensory transducer [Osedax symbiont Rs2]